MDAEVMVVSLFLSSLDGFLQLLEIHGTLTFLFPLFISVERRRPSTS